MNVSLSPLETVSSILQIRNPDVSLGLLTMKLAKLLFALICATASTSFGAVIIYNQNNPPTTGTGNGVYGGFSVAFNDAALSTTFTAPDAGPTLSNPIYLTDLTLRRGTAGGTAPSGDPTNALLKIYTTQTPSAASFVADSTNTLSFSTTAGEANLTYNFNSVALNPATTYYFYFANTTGDGSATPITFTAGRLNVSNAAADTYTSGNLINPARTAAADTAYDAVFSASFNSTPVPEPSSIALAALAGIGVLALRRRRR